MFKMKGPSLYRNSPLKNKKLKKVVSELHNASKMHKKQAKIVDKHIDDMNEESPLKFKGADSSNSSCWKGYRKVGTKKSPSGTGKTVNDCVKIGSPAKHCGCGKPKSPAKMRKTTKGKGRTFRTPEEGAGMTNTGVKQYRAENPGSKLKTAVTGDVKPGSKAAGRRKSFCARSRGWTGERGKAARARWKC